ncbi:hypothetical protein L2E82_04371 [Cichorium intybus]|uniref:Uncharacterized protein n=1 Tax=Cichorium intybus TaxID=13427 RepID=A0ACB9H6E8_CICIN|nr:hypothetical protein L2E82_04371 [Cichorium intybus]
MLHSSTTNNQPPPPLTVAVAAVADSGESAGFFCFLVGIAQHRHTSAQHRSSLSHDTILLNLSCHSLVLRAHTGPRSGFLPESSSLAISVNMQNSNFLFFPIYQMCT